VEQFTNWQRPPRTLVYRTHYRWYAGFLAFCWVLSLVTLGVLWRWGGQDVREELLGFAAMCVFLPSLYLAWLHPKLTRSVQVFPTHVRVTGRNYAFEIPFSELTFVDTPFFSFMRLCTKEGSWWFSAALERPDYLWEALREMRPELTGDQRAYEAFRLRLVQYDHHEKRKEWFFRHRFLDVLNWVALPVLVLVAGHWWQTREVEIHATGLYLFRLTMFSLLATIGCAFSFSLFLKKFVFDRVVRENLQGEGVKRRDLAWESEVLNRAKWAQLAVCGGLMAMVVHTGLNLYSVTRIKEGSAVFGLRPGATVVVDNRYNCTACAHPLQEGDLVVFGKGVIGRILGNGGDVVAQSVPGAVGRSIASESVVTVPAGHVAVQVGDDGSTLAFIKEGDLVGKVNNP